MSKAEKTMIADDLISDRFDRGAVAEPVWNGAVVFPDQLKSDEERIIYEKIYSDLPSKHLIRASVEPILVQLVRHIVRADQIAELLRQPVATTDEFLKLLKAEKECTSVILSACVKLKITPSAIASYRGTLLEQKPSVDERANKPWNFGRRPAEYI
ncbi:hypothetical protein [Devosia insulae]|nr:hypothetical protein [Devosia insulae]